MNRFCFLLCILLSSCTQSDYEGNIYTIDDFVEDSEEIQSRYNEIENEDPILNEEYFTPYQETLIEGDELKVMVYAPTRPDLSQTFETLHPRTSFQVIEGVLHLPLLSPIRAEGMTLCEVRELIRNDYADFCDNIQVFLEFKKKKERKVFIVGGKVSTVAIDPQMRLADVIAISYNPQHTNLYKSRVFRDGEPLPVNFYRLIYEASDKDNIYLRPNDQIFFANESAANVLMIGEVRFNRYIPIHKGFTNLKEALALAGGVVYQGNLDKIYILRGDSSRPKIYLIGWEDVCRRPNSELALFPGDLVCVTPKLITDWNRFVYQIFPSTGVIYQGGILYHRH